MPSPWTRWRPSDAEPWDCPRVVHLHQRAGFAGTWEELQRDLADGVDATVDRFLQGEVAGHPRRNFETIANVLGDSAAASGDAARLKAWWIFRMLQTADPLAERMALVWHNHFATSVEKVTNLTLMREQNEHFRQRGQGPFAELLNAVVKHPAMLIWLDADSNRRGNPNENLARELMEFFTLGEGHYSEQDVRQAAKCLTGWTTSRGGSFTFDPDAHEPGAKRVLDEDISSGDQLLGVLLDHPATPQRLAWRLCHTFLGEKVASQAELDELANILRADNLHLGNAVETILRSQIFFSRENLRTRIQGPAEFVVGMARRLEMRDSPPSTLILAEAAARMDQDLFAPPNVFGWQEGRAWINSRTLVAKANFVHALCHGRNHIPPIDFDPRRLLADKIDSPIAATALRRRLEFLLFGETAIEEEANDSNSATEGTFAKDALTRDEAVAITFELLSAPAAQLG